MAGALVAPATTAWAAAPSSVANGRSVGERCRPGVHEDVAQAYANVFNRSLPLEADQRAASLVDGDDPDVRATLDRWLAGTAGANTSVTVAGVRCPSARRAVVDADLVLGGIPLRHVLPPAAAVRKGGAWKVPTGIFCTRLRLESPTLPCP